MTSPATPIPLATYTKADIGILDYSLNWTGWLNPGDAINTLTMVTDPGITVLSSYITNSGTVTTAVLSGGTNGTHYIVSFEITTVQGLTDERSISIFIRPR
jgi:hypothetical protein